MRTATGHELQRFLMECSARQLLEALPKPWLNEAIPGIGKIVDCDQGMNSHFEGDVAMHTSMVFESVVAITREKLGRDADFIERLAALVHDWKKPVTRQLSADGNVYFPQHEQRAAECVSELAPILGLTADEAQQLQFLVGQHGSANDFPLLDVRYRERLRKSPYIMSLCVLQEADARSCKLRDGQHLPVHWDVLAGSK